MFRLRYATLFLTLIFVLAGHAQSFQDINWKSGQLLGISNRAGLSPIVVQFGSLSLIDHFVFVVVEGGKPWAYEYLISGGVQKNPLEEVWNRSRDPQGKVHFVLGEFQPSLKNHEIEKVKDRFTRWMNPSMLSELPQPNSCYDSIRLAMTDIRQVDVLKFRPSAPFVGVLGGFFYRMATKNFGERAEYPVMSSIFLSMKVANANLVSPYLWSSREQLIDTWVAEGDVTKFARLVAVERRQRVHSGDELKDFISSLQVELKSQLKSYSCGSILGGSL